MVTALIVVVVLLLCANLVLLWALAEAADSLGAAAALIEAHGPQLRATNGNVRVLAPDDFGFAEWSE